MIQLPNRYKSPDIPEEPSSWNKKPRDYEYWNITWVMLERYLGNENINITDRKWWCIEK
ncbi:MAG: hypothetical protein IT280_13400 [Ignavibacteria bacterium]|nr:hypothetical protein [Ignavibacteria bacterium]